MQFKKYKYCLWASILVLAGMGAAPAPAATPDDALIIAWNIDAISTFDPAQIGEVVSDEIFRNVCNSLVDLDPQDETRVVPQLAASWDVGGDENSTELTFHLRDDLTFADGRAASAQDVAWSLKRVVMLNFGNAATLNEYGLTSENIDKQLEVLDDKTLRLKFDKPYPANLLLTAIAANRVASLLDRETIMQHEEAGDLGNKYLTTRAACVGPYQLVQWNAGESVLLEANLNHWDKVTPPQLKRVLIRHVAEPGTQRLLLERGDVDVARNLVAEDITDLDENSDVEIITTLKPTLHYWSFNNGDPILSNEKVRLALRYLIDYEGLGKTVLKGVGVPRASFVQLGAFGALDEKAGQPFSLDLEKAKALLEEAGYIQGFELNLIIGSHSYSSPIAQSIQDQAAKIGIKITIERMANAQLFSKVRAREFQTAMLGWATGVPDAHGNASRQIYNPDNRIETGNSMYPSWRSAYFDEEVNTQVMEALFEKDEAERLRKYHALQHKMMESGPQAYILQVYNVAAVRPNLKNWTGNSFRTYYNYVEK